MNNYFWMSLIFAVFSQGGGFPVFPERLSIFPLFLFFRLPHVPHREWGADGKMGIRKERERGENG